MFSLSFRMNFTIYLLILFNLKLLTTSQFCGTYGKIDYCCDNYYFDSIKKDCLECPNGSYGRNCSKTCVIPKYGWLCYETCECKNDEYCDIVSGCLNASTTSAPTSTPLVETSTPEIKESSSVTDTHSTYRTDSADITELHSNKKNTFDVKSAITVSVSVASTAVFVLVVGGITFCCVYKRKLSYPFQNTQHDASSNDPDIQVRVPLSNLETEVYMEIEDISPTQSGDLPDKDKDHVKTNYDQLSKTVSDSSKYSEIGKYYTDIEKYKTFTTHKALYHHRELKRHNSWHYVIEKPLNSRSPPFTRKANSYLELCEDSDYLEAVHKLKNIEACRDFIYANMNTSQLANPISSFHSKNAVSYDDFVSIIKEC